jgi:hypothetical protein
MSIYTKNIGAERSAPVRNQEQTTQPEKTKKSAAVKDTLQSAAKETSAPEVKEKSCGEKIKACFQAIFAWIKDHLLCCIFGKKSNASAGKIETEEEKNAKIAKAAVKKFKTEIQKQERIHKEAQDLNKLLNSNASDEEIQAGLAKLNRSPANGPSDIQKLFNKEGRDGVEKLLKPMMKMMDLAIRIGEIIYFISDFRKSYPSKIQAQAVFDSLQSESRKALVDTFNKVNKKKVTEQEFIAIFADKENDKAMSSMRAVEEYYEEQAKAKAEEFGMPSSFLND